MATLSIEEQFDYVRRTSLRMHDLRQQAINDLVKTAYKRYYRKQVLSGECKNELLNMVAEEIGKESFDQDPRGRKKLLSTKFITIGAKDGIDPKAFFKQMSKCVRKQKLQAKTGHYVLEQRSEPGQEPYGWHIHWLVDFEATTSPAVIAQQTYQCFTRFLAGANYVDVKEVFNQEQWERQLKYMGGQKTESKMAKVKQDVILREQLGIEKIISY